MATTMATNATSTTNANATITMEFPKGYPMTKSLQVISYRSPSSTKKEIIEEVVATVKTTALEALGGSEINVDVYGEEDESQIEGEECGLLCCSVAIERWTTLIELEENERQQERKKSPLS